MNFDSHVNGAVLAAVALINALTPGHNGGRPVVVPTGRELARAATAALRSGSLRPVPNLTVEGAEQLSGWAKRLRGVIENLEHGKIDDACWALNEILDGARAAPTLTRHDDEPWHLHFHRDGASVADGWAAGMATGLAVALGSPAFDRLGVCQAPTCDRVYIDASRNGSRRFCSTACQNRVKAAAYRRRNVHPVLGA